MTAARTAVWSLWKRGHNVECDGHPVQNGVEGRLLWNGGLVDSRLHATEAAFLDWADVELRHYLRRGWVDLPRAVGVTPTDQSDRTG